MATITLTLDIDEQTDVPALRRYLKRLWRCYKCKATHMEGRLDGYRPQSVSQPTDENADPKRDHP